MKSILGIGNALTDILAILPDDELLKTYHLPKGSMQHVDAETGNKIWHALKQMGVLQYVPGGSAANTITGTSIFGMPSGFIGKVGDDELGHLFKTGQENIGIKPTLLKGTKASGRAMVFITAPNAERTFAVYLGSAIELVSSDLKPEFFEGYDYFHIEGYLISNQPLVAKAISIAKSLGIKTSIDLASYNVVEENLCFLKEVCKDVDIIFANEGEAKAFTNSEAEKALDIISEYAEISVVKIGKKGSLIKSNNEKYIIKEVDRKLVDTTGAGDMYAAGFLAGLCNNYSLEKCGKMGSILAGNVIEVYGAKMDENRWERIKEEISNIEFK